MNNFEKEKEVEGDVIHPEHSAILAGLTVKRTLWKKKEKRE